MARLLSPPSTGEDGAEECDIRCCSDEDDTPEVGDPPEGSRLEAEFFILDRISLYALLPLCERPLPPSRTERTADLTAGLAWKRMNKACLSSTKYKSN